ncbi:MAG: metallophosphoesterase family protein [Acidobacteriota bacterium]
MRQLLHISDVHFGPHFRPEVAAGVMELAERRRPDLVVLSGDLTQRAKPEQFRDARAWVEKLPVPWIAVPGNHDVPAYRFWERLTDPYGAYRRHFAEEMEPVFEDDSLFVVGVNTAFNWTVKDGRFTSAGLERMARLFEDAPRDKTRLVVAHHELTPPPRYHTQRVALRAVEAIRLMVHYDVEMVFSGHQHQTYIATSEEYQSVGGPPVLFLHSGTTTSGRGRCWEKGRNSCNWVEIRDERLSIHHLMWSAEENAFLEWSRRHYPRRSARPYSLDGALQDAIR